MGKCFCATDKYVLQFKYLKCSEKEKLFAIRTHAASVQHASLEESNFEFVFHFSCSCGKQRVELAGTNTQKASKLCNIFQMQQSVKKVTDIKCAKSTGLSKTDACCCLGRNIRFHLWDKLSSLANGKCATYCCWIILEDFLQQRS